MVEQIPKEKGLRFNKGKTRYELIPTRPLKALADVYTLGAHKYTLYRDKEGKEVWGKDIPYSQVSSYEIISDGANNWRKGLSWKDTIGSLKRHIEQFEECEDFDKELGTYHLANACWGLFSILEFYHTHPELDDRNHPYLTRPRIGLDIDDVLCNWAATWAKHHEMETPTAWQFDRAIMDKFKAMEGEDLNKFYSECPPLINGKELPFEPVCYVTSRPVTSEISEAWLDKHNFPAAPVYTVGLGKSKIEVLKEAKVDIFVDDRYENFVELNKAGICCYLFDAPHNQRYDVGYKRIKSLNELI